MQGRKKPKTILGTPLEATVKSKLGKFGNDGTKRSEH